jgi:hypothetical protein
MKHTSICAGVSALLISGAVVAVTSVAVGAESGSKLEKVCQGQGVDEDCLVGPPWGTNDGHASAGDVDPGANDDGSGNADLAAANLAAAPYQDVAQAEAAGYVSTLDTLGCFEDPQRGGMGVHYSNEALMDATVDISAPEALVYELDAEGQVTELVAHEYIVPIDAWTENDPPRLFGRDFYQHPSLPMWILHTWIWKDNPMGVFEDFNPRVRPCPDGVPVYGEQRPEGD